MIRSYLTLIILTINSFDLLCQNIQLDDTLFLNTSKKQIVDKVKNSKYNKAPILSALLPGLGQIHNKQYWKLPVIYGGYLLIGHYINFNNNMYKEFRTALISEIDDDEMTINPFPNFNEESLRSELFSQSHRDRCKFNT